VNHIDCDAVAATEHRPALSLLAELARVRAAIRRARKPPSPEFAAATTDELLELYAREREVLRHLRSRRRQWRAQIGIAVATLPPAPSSLDPVSYSRRGTGPAGEDVVR
jgi:hypothetical protein